MSYPRPSTKNKDLTPYDLLCLFCPFSSQFCSLEWTNIEINQELINNLHDCFRVIIRYFVKIIVLWMCSEIPEEPDFMCSIMKAFSDKPQAPLSKAICCMTLRHITTTPLLASACLCKILPNLFRYGFVKHIR